MFRALVFFALLGLINYYVWRRLVRDTGLRGAARVAAIAAIIGAQLPIMITSLSRPGGPPLVQGAIAWPAFIGWAMFALTFVTLLVVDLGRLLVWGARTVVRRPAPTDPSRRQAIARITGAMVTTVVTAEIAVGVRNVMIDAEIVDVPFRLARLPPALDGFTIVQITDVHVGATIGREFVADVVRRANAAGGDMIVLTGDIVDGTVDELRDAVAPFAELHAPHGVYFITGNHEYYSGVDAWDAHFRELGIRVLRNERVSIERDGAAFDLVGIDDHHGKPDLAGAVAGRDPSRALVLLAHQPRQVHDAARHGVDLQISGHTHGGQVWPWHYLVSLQQGGLLAGRYRIGDTDLYVSRGCGYWGPPVRVAAPAEIPRIILRSTMT